MSCRVSWKKNEVADTEATTFAIFYNNALFLFLVLAFLYFMRSFPPLMYPSLPPRVFICPLFPFVLGSRLPLPSAFSLPSPCYLKPADICVCSQFFATSATFHFPNSHFSSVTMWLPREEQVSCYSSSQPVPTTSQTSLPSRGDLFRTKVTLKSRKIF